MNKISLKWNNNKININITIIIMIKFWLTLINFFDLMYIFTKFIKHFFFFASLNLIYMTMATNLIQIIYKFN